METPEVPPQYAEDGVDVSLIRWFLSLTPDERLAALEEHLDDLEQIRILNHDSVPRSSQDPGEPRS